MHFIDPSTLGIPISSICFANAAWEYNEPDSPTGSYIIDIPLKNIPESLPYTGNIYTGPNGEIIRFFLNGE